MWIEGDHLCAALRCSAAARPPQAVITEDGLAAPALRALAGRADAVAVVPDALMAALSTLESPAPLGFVLPWPGAGELAADAPSVVLDRLQDAGNVGTILRSAAAFGFTQVVALKGTAALWSPKVLRAGMGAHFGAAPGRRRRAPTALGALPVPLLATSSHAARRSHEARLPWPCAWVFGHEGQGVSPALLRALRRRRCASRSPAARSRSTSRAAAAVCLYESARQRA